MASEDNSASSVICSLPGGLVSMQPSEVKSRLEKGDITVKRETLKQLIQLEINGESQSHHIMNVIKYCTPESDHTLKKLLMYFWEVVEKTDDDGKLLPEMILMCSFLRNDLTHPNEYIRGLTLRFLCKIKVVDILEPLISTIRANLTHDTAFVRRNAIVCVQNVFTRFPHLMPDAPDMIYECLQKESDESARRHAFNMLFNCSQKHAVRSLAQTREEVDDVTELGDLYLLSVVESSKQLIAQNPYEKSKYVPMIFGALQSKSSAVLYQCANTLLALSASRTATKDAVSTLTHILMTHSDANVRLIVLDRLVQLKETNAPILQENLLDIMRGLSSGDVEIRGKIIDLAVCLVTPKNIDLFLSAMKKELISSQSEEIAEEAQQAYRQRIVKAMHTVTQKNFQVAKTVVPVLLDYICEPTQSAHDVILFIREVMSACPELHSMILNKLLSLFNMISSAKVLRTVLWLFGVHTAKSEEIKGVVTQLKSALEPMPLSAAAAVTAPSGGDTTTAQTTVREDGTYVMALIDKRSAVERSDLTGLRAQIVSGDYFLGSTLAATLSKLIVRLFNTSASADDKAAMQNDAVTIINEVIRFGTKTALVPLDDDCHERCVLALTLTQNPKNEFLVSIVDDSLNAFEKCRSTFAGTDLSAPPPKESGEAEEVVMGDIDQPIVFSQLSHTKSALLDFDVDDVASALANDTKADAKTFLSKLNRTVQLSGSNDPVYCEATVTVHQFDIAVEIYAVNVTGETLSNLTIELATTGDLKLCERPQTYILPPGAYVESKHNIKVSSTETGAIFGNIVFDAPHNERMCVILNQIHVDIMEYIHPATCHPTDFRSRWIEFEWENKIVVNTELTDPIEFVEYVMAQTNMRSIEPLHQEQCGYLSASLYAKTTFGEDALANISLERTDEGHITGVVRIRAKTQGIALGLGDKVGMKSKAYK